MYVYVIGIEGMGQQESRRPAQAVPKLGIWLWSSAFGVDPVARRRDVR
jgi:hypothetical protein